MYAGETPEQFWSPEITNILPLFAGAIWYQNRPQEPKGSSVSVASTTRVNMPSVSDIELTAASSRTINDRPSGAIVMSVKCGIASGGSFDQAPSAYATRSI